MPARGNEKPYAETRVRVLQRQWATPVPRCADLDTLNVYLRHRCLDEAGRTVAGYEQSIGQRFAQDRARALPLPTHRVRRLHAARRRRWTSTRRCVSTATATACRGTAPSDGDRQGLRRPRRSRGGGQVVARHAAATAVMSRYSTRCTTWRHWGGGQRRWTTHRCCATGTCPSRSRACGRLWRHGTARRPGHGTTSACLQLLGEHPVDDAPAAPWRRACATTSCRPSASELKCGAWRTCRRQHL